MSQKNATKKIQSEIASKNKVEEAMRILQEEEKKKAEAFLSEYRALCLKHGLELTATPSISWAVNPVKK